MAEYSKATWRRAEAVIDRLLEQGWDPSSAHGANFHESVAAFCPGDEALQREVLDLWRRMQERDVLDDPLGELVPGLIADVEADDRQRLDLADGHPRAGPSGRASDPERSAAGGLEIDRYRTTALLGRGGMGVVYRAERADGTFDKEVALKILPVGLDSPEAMRRFRRERQILARLEHPNIARLLDGGVTRDGSPYLVMELVEGRAVDRYCVEEDLSTRQRVELFLQVCAAVRYAHRNLVVHRDVKPSNCLVTREGVVKLLDFGIGKILEDDGLGSDPGTVVQPMTPGYASPEQLANQPVSISTDVYSLGLLLFRVLTGEHAFDPFARDRTPRSGGGWPSSSGGRSQGAAGRAVGSVDGDGARRHGALRGDLEVIVRSAIRPDPDQRTGSVEDLHADLQRWLEGRPIAARPISGIRRFGKFVLRHRLATAATALVLLLTLAGVVAIATQGRIAARERDRARVEAARSQRVVEFLTGILQASSADARGSGERTARELLEEAEARIRGELGDDPTVLASMLQVMATSYSSFAEDEKSLELAEEAVRLLEGQQPPPSRELAESRITLANVRASLGQLDGVEETYRRALAELEGLGAAADPEVVARAHRGLGSALRRTGRLEESLVHARLAMEQSAAAGHVVDAAIDATGVAMSLSTLGRLDESLRLNQEALEVFLEVYGESHPNTISTRNNIANALISTGRPGEASAIYRAAFEAAVDVFGEDNRRVGSTLANLSRALLMHGEAEEALSSAERAVTVLEQGLEPDHPNLVGARMNLASALAANGELERAASLYRDGLERFVRIRGPGSLAADRIRSLLAAVLVEQSQHDQAEDLLTLVLDPARHPDGRMPSQARGETLLTLGHLRALQGRCTEAATLVEESRALLGAAPSDAAGSPVARRARTIESLCPRSVGGPTP